MTDERPPSPSPIFGFFLAAAGVAILLVIAYHWANYSPAGAETSAKEAIQRVINDQAAAWNRGDLEGFMAGYWNSPDLCYFGAESRRGWQPTMEHYRQRYQTEPGGKDMGQLTFSDLEIDVVGADRAWARGRWQVTKGGETKSGLFTVIFKKMPEGWRIVHDHTSQAPAKAG